MTRLKPFSLLLLLLLLLPAACSRRQEPTLTFAVGGAPAELDFWERLLAQFMAETGIAVEMLRQPTDSDLRRQGLVIPLQAGQDDPDVFLMDVVWLAQFAASDWLRPLTPMMRREGLDEEVFFQRVVDLVDRRQGELVALPVYIDGGLLYYREDLLRRHGFSGPPATWPELAEQALRIQEAERRERPGFFGFVWQGAQYEGLICNFLEFAAANGGGILGPGGEVAIDTGANREALAFMRDLIHRLRISPPSTYTEMKEEEAREAFQQGAALFERNWPYAWSLHHREGSPVAGRVGIAPLPRFPGGRSVAALGGWHVGISRHTDAPEAAWRLVSFLTSYAVQKQLALHLGWNPGRRDLYRDPQVLADLPHFGELREVFDHALPRPVVPYYTQLSEVLQRRLNAVLAGREAPAEALAAAQREVRDIAQRYDGP